MRASGCVCFLLLAVVSLGGGSRVGHVHHVQEMEEEASPRRLYATFPVEGGHYSVDTLSSNITKPSGIEAGYFKGQYGFFVSSTVMYTISFFHHRTFERTLVAGVPNTHGSHDAQLLYSLFASPTRLAYDTKNNRLYVAERRSGNIRILDFPSDQTKTLKNAETEANVRLQYNIQTVSTYPGMDLQIGGDVLYAVDTVKLYSITAADGSGLAGLPYAGAVVKEHTALTQYFGYNGYEVSASLRSCVYSVAPDTKRGVLYVTVSYARNVILQVPMDPSAPYTDITVLLGDESASFMGNVGGGGSVPPAIQNGNLYSRADSENADADADAGSLDSTSSRMLNGEANPSNILLSFPIHARLSADMSVLYFSEAYPTQSGDRTLFGSLSIRRLVFATGEVDSYAGIDHSHDNNTGYSIIGGEGGNTDGLVEEAEFVYPMSIAVISEGVGSVGKTDVSLGASVVTKSTETYRGIRGEGGSRVFNQEQIRAQNEEVEFDTLVVADHSSHSVRRVFAYMDTATPSSQPTVYTPPTRAPTPFPTSWQQSSAGGAADNVTITALTVTGVTFLFLLCGLGVFCVCSTRRKKPTSLTEAEEEGAGRVEMTSSRSSANLLTMMAHKASIFFNGRGTGEVKGPRYEEMDASSSNSNSWSDVDLSSSGKWSDLPPSPRPTSKSSSPPKSQFRSSSDEGGGGFSLGRLWKEGRGYFGHESLDHERGRAVHSLLDVSDSSCESN